MIILGVIAHNDGVATVCHLDAFDVLNVVVDVVKADGSHVEKHGR
jgi:hypothetical protein